MSLALDTIRHLDGDCGERVEGSRETHVVTVIAGVLFYYQDKGYWRNILPLSFLFDSLICPFIHRWLSS